MSERQFPVPPHAASYRRTTRGRQLLPQFPHLLVRRSAQLLCVKEGGLADQVCSCCSLWIIYQAYDLQNLALSLFLILPVALPLSFAFLEFLIYPYQIQMWRKFVLMFLKWIEATKNFFCNFPPFFHSLYLWSYTWLTVFTAFFMLNSLHRLCADLIPESQAVK